MSGDVDLELIAQLHPDGPEPAPGARQRARVALRACPRGHTVGRQSPTTSRSPVARLSEAVPRADPLCID
jgi:hypothetical protein